MTLNPILLRHLHTTVRRNTIFWLLGTYLLLEMLFFTFVLTTIGSSRTFLGVGRRSLLDFFVSGRALFWSISSIMLGTAWMLAPLPALGMIAGERSRRTLDILKLTTLPRSAITLGKMGAALLEGGLFILAPIPIFFFGFWTGGISTAELILTIIFLVVTMTGSTAIALFISARMRQTLTAVLVYYGLIFASWAVAGTIASSLGMFIALNATNSVDTPYFLVVAAYVIPIILSAFYPPSAAIATEVLGIPHGEWFLVTVDIHHPTAGLIGSVILPSPWIIYTFLVAIVTILALIGTTRTLKRKER